MGPNQSKTSTDSVFFPHSRTSLKFSKTNEHVLHSFQEKTSTLNNSHASSFEIALNDHDKGIDIDEQSADTPKREAYKSVTNLEEGETDVHKKVYEAVILSMAYQLKAVNKICDKYMVMHPAPGEQSLANSTHSKSPSLPVIRNMTEIGSTNRQNNDNTRSTDLGFGVQDPSRLPA